MPRHARGSRRERVAWSAARWLIAVAATGGLAAGEAVRVAAVRATVPVGWGTGIAAGAGAGFVLAALFAVSVRVRRRWPQAILVLVAFLLWVVAGAGQGPLPGRHGADHRRGNPADRPPARTEDFTRTRPAPMSTAVNTSAA